MRDYESVVVELWVAETLDTGFRNVDVYRTLFKVMIKGRGVKGMHSMFRKHLSVEGQIYVMNMCDRYIQCWRKI